MRLEGNIDICEPGRFAGWARDIDDPGAPLRLTAWTGRTPLGTCLADQPRADLAEAGLGAHGFSFIPPHPLSPAECDALHVRAEHTELALFHAFGGAQPNPFLAAPPPRPAQARFRRCILHIGTEKTGTTSLQRFLALNRVKLLAQGVFVPLSLAPADPEGSLNHSDLAALALADWRLDDALRLARGVSNAPSLARFRGQAAAALAAEFATVPPEYTTLLLSSEHCHSRMQLLHEIAALHGFLAPWVESFEVVVYLRPQHELAMSQYAMHLLSGQQDAEMLPALPYPAGYALPRVTDPVYFDYAGLLSRWAAIFGRDAIRPAIFGAEDLHGGDVIDDFCHRLGLSTEAMARPPRLATNISGRAQTFLRALLPVARARGGTAAAAIIGFVAANLRRSAPGEGTLPPRAQAEAFAQPFAAGNARLRAEWFPDRARLFNIDFGRFPAAVDEVALSAEEAVAQLVDLLLAETTSQG